MDASEGREDRRREVLMLDDVAWGDVEDDLGDVEELLGLMAEAATKPLRFWQTEGVERYGDEFSVSTEQREAMDERMHAAYVAQLNVTLASRLGANSHDGKAPASSILGIAGRLERAA